VDLPIKVNGVVYTMKEDIPYILLLKRSPEDGGFWQTLTGTLKDGEKIMACLKRELEEETGMTAVLKVTEEIYRFGWQDKFGKANIDLVFGVEVGPRQEITLSNEHTDFLWLEFDKAFELLTKENLKNSLLAFRQKVLEV
jgi:lipoyl(octanoyl) transferase